MASTTPEELAFYLSVELTVVYPIATLSVRLISFFIQYRQTDILYTGYVLCIWYVLIHVEQTPVTLIHLLDRYLCPSIRDISLHDTRP